MRKRSTRRSLPPLRPRYPPPQLEISGLDSGESAVVQNEDIPYDVVPPQDFAPQAPQQVPQMVVTAVPASTASATGRFSSDGKSRTRSTESFTTSRTSRTLSTASSSPRPSSLASSSASFATTTSSSSSSHSPTPDSSTSAAPSASSVSSNNGGHTLSHGVPFYAAIVIGVLIGIACISLIIAYFVRIRSVRHRAVDKIRWSPVVPDVERAAKGGENGDNDGMTHPVYDAMRSAYSITGDRDVGEPKQSGSFLGRHAFAAPYYTPSQHSSNANLHAYQNAFGGPQLNRASVDAAYVYPGPYPTQQQQQLHPNPFTDPAQSQYPAPTRRSSAFADSAVYPLPPPASTLPPRMIFPGPLTTSPRPLPASAMGGGPDPNARPLPAEGMETLTRESSRTGSVLSHLHSAATLGPLRVANAPVGEEAGVVQRKGDLPPAEQTQQDQEQQEQGWGETLRANVFAALQAVAGVGVVSGGGEGEGDNDRLTPVPVMARERSGAVWARFRRRLGERSDPDPSANQMAGYLNVPAPHPFSHSYFSDSRPSLGASSMGGASSMNSDTPLIKKPARPAAVASTSMGSVYSVASSRGRVRTGDAGEAQVEYHYW